MIEIPVHVDLSRLLLLAALGILLGTVWGLAGYVATQQTAPLPVAPVATPVPEPAPQLPDVVTVRWTR